MRLDHFKQMVVLNGWTSVTIELEDEEEMAKDPRRKVPKILSAVFKSFKNRPTKADTKPSRFVTWIYDDGTKASGKLGMTPTIWEGKTQRKGFEVDKKIQLSPIKLESLVGDVSKAKFIRIELRGIKDSLIAIAEGKDLKSKMITCTMGTNDDAEHTSYSTVRWHEAGKF